MNRKITFNIPYYTNSGQQIVVSANIAELGNNNPEKGLFLENSGGENNFGEIELSAFPDQLCYKYYLYDEQRNSFTVEWGERKLDLKTISTDVICYDWWNVASSIDNVYMTSPFQRVFMKSAVWNAELHEKKTPTHRFIVKAPFLNENEIICLIGDADELGAWSVANPILMTNKDETWLADVHIENKQSLVHYKYGVYDVKKKHFLYFEQGADRSLLTVENSFVVKNDDFFRLANHNWRGAGVGLPVSSIRTRKSFGVGDFVDLKRLVDWASHVGIKLIQVLPLNDTIGTHTEDDVLPYAAISAFALHPLYLNLPALGEMPKSSEIAAQYIPKQAELNAKDLMPYLDVVNFKLQYAKEAYLHQKEKFLKDQEFLDFFEKNAYWLKPYAAYCVLRDRFKTNKYRTWGEYAQYDKLIIEDFVLPDKRHYDLIAVNYFIQFHLHKQLREAGEYANKHQVVLKGDIPIGVNKYSVDTWVNPVLFHMDMLAGAPPDMFAVKGQNWALPTYNWEEMKRNHYKWWKKRFEQMSNYFDTFRIDHILGFFRIWQIPSNQTEGIMGYLNPSIPIHIDEFAEKGVQFDYDRFCKPYITDDILNQVFGSELAWVRAKCLQVEDGWKLRLRPEFTSQVYIEKLYEKGDISERVRNGLVDLISNVLFFELSGSNKTQFYPRFGMHSISAYYELDEHTKWALDQLYIDYFYHRQNDFWYQKGMEKLPALKRATNMLICGEDLGMMNPAVSAVMKDLGILSLEVQRMPKSGDIEFAHPNYAPYLSVVTPSTHDMSTVRGWWEEDRGATQRFYNEQLEHGGEAPTFCEWWISRDVVLQHLHSPALWAVFQWQDLMGMSEKLRRENPHEERINDPSNSKASWRYRMHISIENLLEEEQFNNELRNYIVQSGR